MIRTGEYVVIAFDICSSSSMVDMLTHSNRAERLAKFYGCIKRWLWDQQEGPNGVGIIPYKFMGDGWIVLIPASTTGQFLRTFVRGLCEAVHQELANHLDAYLDRQVPLRGVNMGIDVGSLLAFPMFGAREYIGRSINISCRLQSAIKAIELDTADNAAYKALVSTRVYEDYLREQGETYAARKDVVLRNVNEGQTTKVWLVDLLRDGQGIERPLPDRPPYAPAPCVASRPRSQRGTGRVRSK